MNGQNSVYKKKVSDENQKYAERKPKIFSRVRIVNKKQPNVVSDPNENKQSNDQQSGNKLTT